MLSLIPDLERELNLLCLGAHPDDIEIGAGATILQLAAGGWINTATWVVFSGTRVRVLEGTASANAFLDGASSRSIVFHEIKDGYFPARASDVKDAFEEIKASTRPDLLFAPRLDDAHQDHRLVAELTWNTFRDHMILEYEIPKFDGDLTTPNLYVPLDSAALDRKIDLIMTSFRSQVDRSWFDPETFRAIARIRGIEAGAGTRYAEAFHARKMRLGISGDRLRS